MVLEMKVPSPGESITEVEIATWLVKDGDYVKKDQAIAEVDSDKATLELPAEASGVITLKAQEGDSVAVGQVVCLIDTDAPAPAETAAAPAAKAETPAPAPVAAPAPAPKVEAPAPSYATGTPSPAAKKILEENGLNNIEIIKSLGELEEDKKIQVNQELLDNMKQKRLYQEEEINKIFKKN